MASITGKVLITGGLGYLGGRIATHLAAAAPRLSLRLTTRRTIGNVPNWAQKLEVVNADVRDQRSLEAAVDGVDTVVHLAAVNEIEAQKDPDLALEVNGRGTYKLLQACQSRGVKRFVYLSTYHVYGPGAPQPIIEETPTRPVHPYAITHRLAEDYVNWFRHSYGVETLIVRLSNGYGYPADPWVDRWTLAFNDFCLQAVKTGEIRLSSGGAQHRDFVSLADVARGIEYLLGLPRDHWGDGLLNFGGDCSLSILQAANVVAREFSCVYGREVPVTTAVGASPLTEGPIKYSIEKLKQTGFYLTGNMSQEVRRTFAVCEELAHISKREP